MTSVTSADGSSILADDLGSGRPAIVLPGALCTRGVTRPLADLLAVSCRVLDVDRRGHGHDAPADVVAPLVLAALGDGTPG